LRAHVLGAREVDDGLATQTVDEIVIAPSERIIMPVRNQNENVQMLTFGSRGQEIATMNRTTEVGRRLQNRNRSIRAFEGFNLYRTNIVNINNENLWTPLAEGITETEYNDTSWGAIDAGRYVYIVRALYSNDVVSLANASSILDPDQIIATVTVNITTEDSGSAEGTIIRLISIDENHEEDLVYQSIATGNSVAIPGVIGGRFLITATHPEYIVYRSTERNITSETFAHNLFLTKKHVLLSEEFNDFDADFPPEGWALAGGDDFGNNWQQWIEWGTWRTFAGSESVVEDWDLMMWIAANPDNYLITPLITIPAGHKAQVDFWRGTPSPGVDEDRYSVMVSQGGIAPSDFAPIFTEKLSDTTPRWTFRSLPLDEYAGQTIRLAWRHHDSHGVDLDRDLVVSHMICINRVIVFSHTPLPVHADDREIVPMVSQLRANFPNPFNPSTTISFDVAKEGNVQIEVFNIRGQKVKTLLNETRGIGNHSVVWEGTDNHGRILSSGVYFYRMTTGEFSQTRRMLLLK